MNSVKLRVPLLIALAARLPSREPDFVKGWTYRRDIGAWVDADDTATLMVVAAKPAKPKPRPVSKKEDQETGEDMKGE
jgi:hypothetical protein